MMRRGHRKNQSYRLKYWNLSAAEPAGRLGALEARGGSEPRILGVGRCHSTCCHGVVGKRVEPSSQDPGTRKELVDQQLSRRVVGKG